MSGERGFTERPFSFPMRGEAKSAHAILEHPFSYMVKVLISSLGNPYTYGANYEKYFQGATG